jgi:hypothetical protein
MSNFYVIQWKSKVNGRAGRGTKQFDKAEAEQLVIELNREYPQIVHEMVEAQPAAEDPAGALHPIAETAQSTTPMLSIA